MNRAGLLAATTMFTAIVPACGSSDSGQTTPDQPTRIRVVSAFYPLAYLAHRIGGEQVIVQNLTQPAAEPHDLELRPKQIAAVADADVVVYEKGFQPAVYRPRTGELAAMDPRARAAAPNPVPSRR
jgi:zinc transport system substrate-binding protein